MKESGSARLLVALLLVAVGFFAGRFSGGDARFQNEVGDGPSAGGADGGAPSGRDAPTGVGEGAGASDAGRPIRAAQISSGISAGSEREPAAMAIEELRDELTRARGELRQLKQEREWEQGKPIPFPADLDEAFRQEKLVANLNTAFEAAGVPGEVAAADCTEYPCILCGDVGRDEGEPKVDRHLQNLRKAGKAESLAPYKDAKKHGSVFTTKHEQAQGEAVHTTVFCQAYYPDPGDEALDAEIQKRLRYRVDQLKLGMVPE